MVEYSCPPLIPLLAIGAFPELPYRLKKPPQSGSSSFFGFSRTIHKSSIFQFLSTVWHFFFPFAAFLG